MRLARGNDLFRIGGRHSFRSCAGGFLRRGELVDRNDPIVGVLDCIGIEGGAVVEGDTLLQLERIAQPILAGFPGFSKTRHDLGGRWHPDERLAHIEHDADGRIEKRHLRVERAIDIEAESVDQRAALLVALQTALGGRAATGGDAADPGCSERGHSGGPGIGQCGAARCHKLPGGGERDRAIRRRMILGHGVLQCGERRKRSGGVVPSVVTACVVSLQIERVRPSFDECHMIPVHEFYQIAAALERPCRAQAANVLTPRIE